MTDRIPCCGVRRCRLPATYADDSGVGFCRVHAPKWCKPVTEDNPLDPWWVAATLAHDAGGEERERWRGLEYGQYPEVTNG